MAIQTIRCSNHSDAARALAGNARARFLGGGTLVMRQVNQADQSFDTIVRITGRRGPEIRVDGDRLQISSDATMAELLQNRDAAFLHDVARLVGGPAVRNMATVGGNLFAPCPYGDLTTALLALDAELMIADSEQRVPLQEFLQTRSEPNQPLIVAVSCKRPENASDFRFHKVSRVKPKGISVLCIAAHLPGSSSTLQQVRIAYGAMADTPIRISAVERVLEGQRLDSRSIEAAMGQAVSGLSPPTDAIASSWYRQTVAPVHLGRLLSKHGRHHRQTASQFSGMR